MMFLTLTSCTLAIASLASAAIPGPTVPRHSAPDMRMDSIPVLPANTIPKMTTVWKAVTKEADSVWRKDTVFLPIEVMNRNMYIKTINMPTVAAAVPAVDAALKATGLTPEQWLIYYAAVAAASLEKYVMDHGWDDVKPTSVVGQNVALLRTHQQELDTLTAAVAAKGMPFPTVHANGIPQSSLPSDANAPSDLTP